MNNLYRSLIKIELAKRAIYGVKVGHQNLNYKSLVRRGLKSSLELISDINFRAATGFSKVASSNNLTIKTKLDFENAVKYFLEDRMMMFTAGALRHVEASAKDSFLQKARNLDLQYVEWMRETRLIWLEMVKEAMVKIPSFTEKEAEQILIDHLKNLKEYDEFKEQLEKFKIRTELLIILAENLKEETKNTHDVASWLKNLKLMLKILSDSEARFQKLILESISIAKFRK